MLRLALRRLRSSWLDRLATWVAVCLVVGWGAVIAMLHRAEDLEVGFLVCRALVSLSWSAGLMVALASARPLVEEDRRDGIGELLASRGVDSATLPRAYYLATVWRIGTLVSLPAFTLWLWAIALSYSLDGLAGRLLLAPAIVVYVAIYAIALGGAARWVAGWIPRRSRPVFLALIGAPYLLGLVWSVIPSVPELFSALASRLAVWALGGW